MADQATAVTAFLAQCVTRFELGVASPAAPADLVDAQVLAKVAEKVFGPGAPGTEDLVGASSLSAVANAVVIHASRTRKCTEATVRAGVAAAGEDPVAQAVHIGAVLLVLAVTSEHGDPFIECIDELADGDAEALQGAVQHGMEEMEGIAEIAGEEGAAVSAGGSEAGGAAPAGTAAGAAAGAGHEEDDPVLLRTELHLAREEARHLREEVAAAKAAAKEASAAGSRAGPAGDAAGHDDDRLNRGLSAHLQLQVAQLEASLSSARAEAVESEQEARQLRDELDVARSAVVDAQRLRHQLEEARADAGVLAAAQAEAEALRARLREAEAAAAAAADETATERRERERELRKQVEAANKSLREVRVERDALEAHLSEVRKQLAGRQDQLATERAARSAAEARARDATARLEGVASMPAPAAVSALTPMADEGADRAPPTSELVTTLQRRVASLERELAEAVAAAAEGDAGEGSSAGGEGSAAYLKALQAATAAQEQLEAQTRRAEEAEAGRDRAVQALEQERLVAEGAVRAAEATAAASKDEMEKAVQAEQAKAEQLAAKGEQEWRRERETVAKRVQELEARARADAEANAQLRLQLRRKTDTSSAELEHVRSSMVLLQSALFEMGKARQRTTGAREARLTQLDEKRMEASPSAKARA
ncbi:hypothetical protein FNF27_06693 [Cafeteria roenbergensis]|uniref:Uncharacterized protein n=1 Tax=Cafeteria roenbergensis TaxID=33653 RepID=A0A5A8DYJ3_CAFRO|nr:hypothetical protein FNF29_07390 [Cafeteria roenbergensis]KAA0158057.1 hypothetical protein FNF31_05559 [Cafeteria roenbergensis]KAA0170259.1 hypothetical protein FNF27_06693 [Cafeteria roenbergensis]|eukprot:KAA0147444.1 hypothetical protein FNF29_07390 [Cafeteria roenbergensis]